MARTQIASDAFTYSNGALQTVSGGNWTNVTTDGGFGTISVSSNRITGGNAGAVGPTARWTGSGTFDEDQYSALDIDLSGYTGSGADYVAGVDVRCNTGQDSASNRYIAYVEDSFPPDDGRVVRIGKIVGGSFTSLASQACIEFNGTGVTRLTLEAVTNGSNVDLAVYADAATTPMFTVSDTTGTRIFGGGPGATDSSAGVFPGDNWAGGDITSGAAFDADLQGPVALEGVLGISAQITIRTVTMVEPQAPLAIAGALGIAASISITIAPFDASSEVPIAIEGTLGIDASVSFQLKRWRVPTNAPNGTAVHMIVFSGAGPTYAIVTQADTTVDASGYAEIPAAGTIGTKAFAFVHNYDDDTNSTSIYGGPGIATIVDVG